MPTVIRFAGRGKDTSGNVLDGSVSPNPTAHVYAEGDTATSLANDQLDTGGLFDITLTPASSALPVAYDVKIINGSEEWWWNARDEVQVKTVQVYNADAGEYALVVVRGEDAADQSVEVGEFAVFFGSGNAQDNDEGYFSFKLGNDAATAQEWEAARLTWVGTDVSDGTEDGRLDISVMTAGTLAKELSLDGTHLYPTTSDGLGLGDGSNMWADLFLASAAVINFNNGAVTITHGAGGLTAAGSLAAEWADLGVVTTVDIDGGTIDGAVVGGVTPAAGTFTTITGSGVLDVTDTTDASDASGDTGAVRTEGGISAAKKIYGQTLNTVPGATTAPNMTHKGGYGTSVTSVWAGNGSLGDDTTATILTDTINQGLLVLTINSSTIVGVGMFAIRAAATPQVVMISETGNLTPVFEVTTSDVTGTTGTDTKITVSVRQAAIEIENRYGAIIQLAWYLIGSDV